MQAPSAVEVVREFWRLMATNDFDAVGAVLSPEFVLEWPQSRERIRGAERFARMNAEYPAHVRCVRWSRNSKARGCCALTFGITGCSGWLFTHSI